MKIKISLRGFYSLFFLRLLIGFATGISYSIYRLYYREPHMLSFAISTAFMLVGLAIFHLIYIAFSKPPRERATRYILTQIAAHYIGSMILIV
ncbi:MAG: hypothetical protein QXQ57_00755 [Sulfolobales archaeon]